MLKEENESSFLKIRSYLKIKFGNNCIELLSVVIVTKKDIFYILNFFPDQMKISLSEYVLNNSSNSF